MCGIVGYIGPREAADLSDRGLRRLEYRGYDSAGVATIDADGELRRDQAAGRHRQPGRRRWPSIRSPGTIGIGHTRWATHGAATDVNAHPHVGGDGAVAVVHNGVIENFRPLKERLESEGYAFRSATDTRSHRPPDRQLPRRATGRGRRRRRRSRRTASPREHRRWSRPCSRPLAQLQGTYGLAVLFRDYPDVIIAARLGSPLVVGVGDGEHFVASDASPLAGYTDQIVYLADHEMAVVTADSLRRDPPRPGARRAQRRRCSTSQPTTSTLDGYPHYMLKEIFEQPETIRNAMRGRLSLDEATAVFGGLNLTPQQLRAVNRIVLTACGTSWHAALVGEYLIEELARIPGRSRIRQRAALSQPAAGQRHAGVRHHAKRRDGRHAGRPARDEAQGAPDAGHLQRRGQHDRPGGRRRHLPARRAGDRRGLDQGLHVAVRRAGDAGPVLRPAAAPELRRRHADHRAAARAARPGRPGAGDQRRRRSGSPTSIATATTFCTWAGSTTFPRRWKGR